MRQRTRKRNKKIEREKKTEKVEIINLLIFSILFLLNDKTFYIHFSLEVR